MVSIITPIILISADRVFIGKLSAGKMVQTLSHNSDRTFQSYVSNIVGIDTQNVVRNLSEDMEHVDFSRSIGFTRDLNAPKPFGATLSKHNLHPTEDIFQETVAGLPKSSRRVIRKKAHTILYMRRRAAHHDNIELVPTEKRCAGNETSARVTPEASSIFTHMLKYNTLQASIIDNLWSTDALSLEECVRPILALANPQKFRPWYQQPVKPPTADMECPYCKVALRERHRDQALHLLCCHCSLHNVNFCFYCAQFIDRGLEPEEKKNCNVHPGCTEFNREDKLCGVVCWRGLVIRPGRCPFCVNIDSIWLDELSLKKHINKHLETLREGAFNCPQRLCNQQYTSRDGLSNHLVTFHGIDMVDRYQRTECLLESVKE
ncbi:hypothetical protein BDV95DRAFT_33231 [Massariosphaeria phaeospora]|uniref:C2H2-type domain-containing protein n=1 Tax=Massariosphaeria phaeospora TaxID=100035 RepID=A0A7C8M8L9_9PLEO|nr:hypothetical protein BDV95DRAFT_33231 [Massariosphaeria phaeospora]